MSESKSDAGHQFDRKLKQLEVARKGVRLDNLPVVGPETFPDFQSCAILLNKTIDDSAQSPEYQRVQERMLEEDYQEKVETQILPDAVHFCPLCQQAISDNYKRQLEKLVARVSEAEISVLSGKVRALLWDSPVLEELLERVEACRQVSLDQPACELDHLEQALERAFGLRDEHNRLIKKKLADPYKKTTYQLNWSPIIENLIKGIEGVQKVIEQYNDKLGNLKDITNSLLELNRELAFYENQNLIKAYKNSVKMKAEAEESYKKTERAYKDKFSKLEDRKNEFKNIQIATEKINVYLTFVFLDRDRLRIETENDRYVIYSNGKKIPPECLSEGEKNVIALAYFFVQVCADQQENHMFKKEVMLVIDDPVSSFDRDNKLGVTAFLGDLIRNFACGNSCSKILLLSHDLSTIQAIGLDSEGLRSRTLRLLDWKTVNLDLKRYNEYKELVGHLLRYIKDEKSDFSDLTVGNGMRRILEAYASFNYAVGIRKLLRLESIENKLGKGNPELGKALLDNYRRTFNPLLLHGESHTEERVKSSDSEDLFRQYSTEKKKDAGKFLLCFLFHLDSLHITHMLADHRDALDTIQGWADQVEELAGERRQKNGSLKASRAD